MVKADAAPRHIAASPYFLGFRYICNCGKAVFYMAFLEGGLGETFFGAEAPGKPALGQLLIKNLFLKDCVIGLVTQFFRSSL